MKMAMSVRTLRLLLYMLVLVGLPTLMALAWILVDLVAPSATPTHFIIISQACLAVLIVKVLVDRYKHYVPSVKERELRASREQFLALFEHSPVPYLTIDAVGHIMMYNLSAVRLLRTTTDAMLGQNLTERFTLENENELSVILGKIEAGYAVTDTEVQVKTMDDRTRWVLVSIFVYDENAERLVSMVDITHQKTVEQAKSEFVALATHQLRTPAAAIRWNLELLSRTLVTTKTDEQGKYLMKLERNVFRMIAIINDFLSVSKLEAGTFSTNMAPLNLEAFFNTIIDEFTQTTTEKSLTLERDFEPRGLMCQTDSRLLHILVSNLMSNAVKYAKREGLVTLRYERVGHEIVIVVSDNGIGIPVEEQTHLFSKFFRASNAMEFGVEGTGLGLYIVKQSALKLGGSVAVESREGVGTIFTVRLPYTQ